MLKINKHKVTRFCEFNNKKILFLVFIWEWYEGVEYRVSSSSPTGNNYEGRSWDSNYKTGNNNVSQE